MDIVSTIILCLIAAAALCLLWREGLMNTPLRAVVCSLLTVLAFGLRYHCMGHETLDYLNFLSVWVEFFRENGGLAALSQSVGNYNVPYLYFLALISYSDIYDLYLIKLISVAFDVLLAWGTMKLAGRLSGGGKARCIFAFFTVLLLPTVLLNGAYWGQCDSIYVSFAVLSVWCALSGRPKTSVAMIALSFSFKLQAVFIMPVFLAFIFTGRIKWRHLAIFPLTYLAVVAPAVIAGRPLLDTLTLYINQGGTVGSGLNYNSSSVFTLISTENTELWSTLGIVLAFSFTLGLLFWLFLARRSLTDMTLLAACALFSVGIPFLLPHMHDRYFFAADIFTLAFAVCLPQFFLLPLCSQFASLLGYHAYLRGRYLLPMSNGALALIAAILLLLLYIASHTYVKRKR